MALDPKLQTMMNRIYRNVVSVRQQQAVDSAETMRKVAEVRRQLRLKREQKAQDRPSDNLPY